MPEGAPQWRALRRFTDRHDPHHQPAPSPQGPRRDAKRAKGDANAALHGEAKPLRDARQAERDRAARVLDAHRRDTPDE
ncbi:DUF4169 family protein [Paracoccus sp. NBH48]|uniref:DUF4169 family protein n=1 Tax=Paracoccus sp. NBH48 TaxID=2596918 RepID=UPI00210453E0|nr:DUF4169 family protein [Paracoccus sp. NBH48]